jgi:hypothetical protein
MCMDVWCGTTAWVDTPFICSTGMAYDRLLCWLAWIRAWDEVGASRDNKERHLAAQVSPILFAFFSFRVYRTQDRPVRLPPWRGRRAKDICAVDVVPSLDALQVRLAIVAGAANVASGLAWYGRPL